MHLFYCKDANEEICTLSPEESLHCVKVLRFKKGDTIQLLNGSGVHVSSTILDDTPKGVVVQKQHIVLVLNQREYHLHMAVSPTKNTNRFEWFVEKATELGIAEITPIITSKTEKKHLKTDRLQKITIEAMKQSKNLFLPVIHNPIDFSDFLQANTTTDSVNGIAWCGNIPKQSISQNLLSDSKKSVFLVGPEGDFTEDEFATAQALGYIPISLGKHRLRTETAALHVCSCIYHIFNTN